MGFMVPSRLVLFASLLVALTGCRVRGADMALVEPTADETRPSVESRTPEPTEPREVAYVDPDRDGDGVLNRDDFCPDERGHPPSGCLVADTDGDGVLDTEDICQLEPENRNGFEDADGCPDEIPRDLANFTGEIKGIYFHYNKPALKLQSYDLLREAAAVLLRYPDVRVEVSAHTDSIGDAEYNKKLSQRRAEAVVEFLVARGVPAERLESRGAGEEDPIPCCGGPCMNDDRNRSRRIEFAILSR